MRVCILGAGAIGGYLGGKLALAGVDVTLIARGAHLESIRRHGLTLEYADGTTELAQPALATADLAEAGPHDYVIVAVKAHSLPALAAPMRVLYGPETAVVYAQNGIPWWYFMGLGGEHDGHQIKAVDPDGLIAASTEVERVIGCVVYPAAQLARPGVIRHIEGNRFTLGEPSGAKSERIERLSPLISAAGLKAPVRPDIRNELWLKLWGNLSFNPISALTRATMDRIISEPLTRALVEQMMREAQTVAERLGVRFPISIERRIAMAEAIGAHKTSMLQDIEAGHPTEVDALVGAVAELGRLTGIPTPHIDALYASVKLLEQTMLSAD